MARPKNTGASIGEVAYNGPLPSTTVSPYAPGTQGNSAPVSVAPAASASNNYIDQMNKLWPDLYAQNEQLKQAASQVLPMYQARLGGLTGPAAEAMRNQSQQAIQAQYGNSLRAAQNMAATQGIRGAAAYAMQNDIRNQMGQATANYNRDLTIANWDAQQKALNDYYGALGTERGGILGTLAGMQSLQNTQSYGSQYLNALKNMQSANNQSGGSIPYPNWLPQPLNPNNFNPLSR